MKCRVGQVISSGAFLNNLSSNKRYASNTSKINFIFLPFLISRNVCRFPEFKPKSLSRELFMTPESKYRNRIKYLAQRLNSIRETQ